MTTHADLDALADSYYLDPPDDVELEERVQRHTLPHLLAAVHGRRTLEMGYGTGLITSALLDRGVDLHLIEGSERLCATARNRHPDLPIRHTLFEQWTPTTPYGAVLALHVLEHVDNPITMIDRIASWLEPGGILVAVVPNAESIHRRVGVAMGLQDRLDALSPRDQIVGHQRVYSLGYLRHRLTLRFAELRTFGTFLKPVSNAQMLDWPPELIDALCRVSEDIDPRLCANIGFVGVKR